MALSGGYLKFQLIPRAVHHCWHFILSCWLSSKLCSEIFKPHVWRDSVPLPAPINSLACYTIWRTGNMLNMPCRIFIAPLLLHIRSDAFIYQEWCIRSVEQPEPKEVWSNYFKKMHFFTSFWCYKDVPRSICWMHIL